MIQDNVFLGNCVTLFMSMVVLEKGGRSASNPRAESESESATLMYHCQLVTVSRFLATFSLQLLESGQSIALA